MATNIPEFMTERANVALEHVADVGTQQVGRVYAEALLNVTEKLGVVDQVQEELDSLVADVLDAQPAVATLLQSSAISRKIKEGVIRKAFADRASPVFLNFLLVLNHHDRLDLLRVVRDLYRELADARRRRVRVLVRSAAPLSDAQRGRLTNDLRTLLGLDPVLDERVVPELLGGVVIRVGDTLFDGSVRNQLILLRNQLLEKSSHEIQSRRDHFSTAS